MGHVLSMMPLFPMEVCTSPHLLPQRRIRGLLGALPTCFHGVFRFPQHSSCDPPIGSFRVPDPLPTGTHAGAIQPLKGVSRRQSVVFTRACPSNVKKRQSRCQTIPSTSLVEGGNNFAICHACLLIKLREVKLLLFKALTIEPIPFFHALDLCNCAMDGHDLLPPLRQKIFSYPECWNGPVVVFLTWRKLLIHSFMCDPSRAVFMVAKTFFFGLYATTAG